MRDRAGDFDAEQACYTQQEAEHACDDAAPEEDATVPVAVVHKLQEDTIFALDENERCQEYRRAEILPVRQLDG